MLKQNYTHIVFLLDRSGSMEEIKAATEEAYNAFIADQRKITGECTVSLIQFDTVYEPVYTGLQLVDIPPLRLDPRGGTALLDAMAKSIDDTGNWLANKPENQRPKHVLFVVMTDGEENSSKEYSMYSGGRQRVFDKVTHQREKYNWAFCFLGAGQDSIATATSMGFSHQNAINYSANADGTKGAVCSLSASTTLYRTSGASNTATFFDEADVNANVVTSK